MRPEFPEQCLAPSRQARLLFYYCPNHTQQPGNYFHIHLDFSKQTTKLCKGGVKFSGIFCNKRGSSLWLAVKRDKWPSANSNSNQEKMEIFMHVVETQFPPVFRYSDHLKSTSTASPGPWGSPRAARPYGRTRPVSAWWSSSWWEPGLWRGELGLGCRWGRRKNLMKSMEEVSRAVIHDHSKSAKNSLEYSVLFVWITNKSLSKIFSSDTVHAI